LLLLPPGNLILFCSIVLPLCLMMMPFMLFGEQPQATAAGCISHRLCTQLGVQELALRLLPPSCAVATVTSTCPTL
jgi:hypothetical protein